MRSPNDWWGAIGGWIGSVFGGSNSLTDSQKVAVAQMAGGTLLHQYEGDNNLQETIQGTISDCMAVRASERSVIKFIVSSKLSLDSELCAQLQDMMDQPNPVQSSIDFMESASHSFDANGSTFIMLINDAQGVACEQWIMPSNYVAPRFDSPENPIPLGYQWKDGRATIPPEQLVIVRRNSIKTSPYKGRGILLESKKQIELLDMIIMAQRNYFLRGGAPNVAIEFPLDAGISPARAREYQEIWSSRYNPLEGTTNVAMIPDAGKVVNFAPAEASYNVSLEKVQADLAKAFNVPLMLLGDIGDANFNNGQVAIAVFERTVVLRFAQKLAAAYQMRFRANYNKFITVEVDPAVIESFTQLSPINGLQTPATAQTEGPILSQEPNEINTATQR